MEREIDNDADVLTLSQFHAALRTVAKKHSEKYNFLLKSGNALLNAVFRLFSLVWSSETIPDSWTDSLLVQLYRGRGSKSNLRSER